MSEKAWVSIDFGGARLTISGIGLRRSDEGGFPTVANVLCWDDHNNTWVHIAHVKPTRPGPWEVYKTVIPKVTTRAIAIYMLSEA